MAGNGMSCVHMSLKSGPTRLSWAQGCSAPVIVSSAPPLTLGSHKCVYRLQEVTWLCREEVKNCPPYIHKKLAPMVKILSSR